jgi:hypothetical protein
MSHRPSKTCVPNFVRTDDDTPAKLMRRVARQGRANSSADHAPTTRVLIVLVGLLRQYEEGWTAMRRHFVGPNAGYFFDVVLATDGRTRCTARDPGCACMGHVPTALAAHFNSSRTRLLRLVWSSRPRAPPPWNRKHTHWSRLSEAWHEVIWPIVRMRQHRHLLVARPDAALSRPLHLATVCARHPDFSLISGGGAATLSDWTPLQRLLLPHPPGVHNHDWDFGSLSCDRPALLGLWLAPWKGACHSNVTCAELLAFHAVPGGGASSARGGCAARAPVEFGGARAFGCGDPFCLVAALFAMAAVRIGTLDASRISLNLVRADARMCNRSRGTSTRTFGAESSKLLLDEALAAPCCSTPPLMEVRCWPWRRTAHVCWWVRAGAATSLLGLAAICRAAMVRRWVAGGA